MLAYSTYLGGDNGSEGLAIAVDTSGNAYVTGLTRSILFPTTPGAFQPTFGGGSDDVFITKLNPAGTALVYSTYLGGSGTDRANRIAVDAAGNAYVVGATSSIDFPTRNPIQAARGAGQFGFNAFVTRVNAQGSATVYSTYLGGSGGMTKESASPLIPQAMLTLRALPRRPTFRRPILPSSKVIHSAALSRRSATMRSGDKQPIRVALR